jgi:hypothetical protein
MSKALEVVYASAPVNDLPIHTLHLFGESFGQMYLCQGFDDLELTLENGEKVTFTACGLGLSLPKRGMKSRQSLQFQIDNVTGEAKRRIKDAREDGNPVYCTYRVYTKSDLTEPADPPITMNVIDTKTNRKSVNIVASFADLINRAWPRARYTPQLAPGLKYFS